MKLVNGEWKYGNVVMIECDGRVIKRKIHYHPLNGLYVVVDGEKIGKTTFEKGE